ncbi:hypothetical protein DYQ86_17715 [Acidobacteria bacterium AB60]|nr:hypothetical protein DYQ86_17715 [Acidobacteria bacterium AB60]
MSQTAKRKEFSETHDGSSSVTPAEVRKTLSTILQSPPFRASLQTQKVLKFLVLETLAGRGDTLKERNIGASLFERPPDYDTNSDPIVRLRVAEVRKRLALYYQGARNETVLINIPSGSFRAVFESSCQPVPALPAEIPREASPTPALAEPLIAPTRSSSATSARRQWWLLAAVAAAVLAIALLRYMPSPEERAFEKFWSPILTNSNTVLIGVGSNPLYELSNAGEDEYYKNHPKTRFEEMGLHSYVPLAPGEEIDRKYLNPAVNTYLTIGDVGALSDIEYVLAQRHIKLDLRFVNDVTYGDLRQNPTILIGAHNNIWTLTTTENLRYGFQGHSSIVDRFAPQKQWTANADRSETYAIVARVLNPWNGKVVMLMGGVGYAGTRGAGDFITNPQSVAKVAATLPKGWESKNIEIVLHTTVKNQVPIATDVVASYAW